ncbi:MAG: hypothetical protein LBG42_00060 [Treponema sp.]|nr:hypothetical protein [Treponema sp.]
MEKIKALKYHNEILLNTSLYKYLSLINDKNISRAIRDVVFDNFVQTTKPFLKDKNGTAVKKYMDEIRAPWQQQIDKTLKDGWTGIKNNLFVSSYTTFELFLNHLVSVYYRSFTKLYSDNEIKISYSVAKDFKSSDELKNYFVNIHAENFSTLGFNEKILYIKKTLKLNDDDIWNLNGKDYLAEIHRRGKKIMLEDSDSGKNDSAPVESSGEISDDEYYLYVNYLCSLIFKLSMHSKIKYNLDFEWIQNYSRYFSIADKNRQG